MLLICHFHETTDSTAATGRTDTQLTVKSGDIQTCVYFATFDPSSGTRNNYFSTRKKEIPKNLLDSIREVSKVLNKVAQSTTNHQTKTQDEFKQIPASITSMKFRCI